MSSVSPDDLARFVPEYMDALRSGRLRPVGGGSNLLQEIADAYMRARGLPASEEADVVRARRQPSP
jgi:hypothetical protein